MPYDLTNPLVIGISSRALFNLEQENAIFEEQGLAAYEEYQVKHENDILQKGSAFQLVKAFLTRAALTGGAPIAPYLHAFKTDLFLSAYVPDVQQAIDNNIAAGVILAGSSHGSSKEKVEQIRIAFDGDAVLFGSDSEKIYQQRGLDAFAEHEKSNADIPLKEGPFTNFLRTIAHIQAQFPDKETAPIRTALVTARNAPAHERAIKTLRNWDVRVDEAFFLGGVSKKDVLSAFGAHIFFDDQYAHARPASEVVPSAVVPYREGDDPRQ